MILFTDFDKSSADDTTIDDLDNTENPDYLCAWVQFISDVSHAENIVTRLQPSSC